MPLTLLNTAPGYSKFLNFLLYFWCGVTAAVFFLEIPVIVSPPGMQLTVKMEIGKYIFSELNRINILFALTSVIPVLAVKNKTVLWLASFCWVIIIVQVLFLMPQFNEELLLFNEGIHPEPSIYHIIFQTAEAVKIVLLAAAGYMMMRGAKFTASE